MTLANLDHIPIQLAMEAEVNSLAQGYLAGLGSIGQGIQALEQQIRLVCVPGKLGQRLWCRTKLFWKMMGRPKQETRRQKTSNVSHPHPLRLHFMCGGAQRPIVIPVLPQQIYFRWISTTEKQGGSQRSKGANKATRYSQGCSGARLRGLQPPRGLSGIHQPCF